MVLVGLLLAYAYPVRVYLAQQAEIAAMEQQQERQRQKIAGLREEREKWDDPEFVKTKLREELQYVLPGDTPYIPFGDSGAGGGQSSDASSDRDAAGQDWYHKLWSSIAAADRPGQP